METRGSRKKEVIDLDMEDDNDDNLDGLDENKKVGVDIANEMFEQVNKKMKKL